MQVKRYLVLIGDSGSIPSVLELPHETLQGAWDALKAEFERTVRFFFGQTQKIRYVNGEAGLNEEYKQFELHKDGPDGPWFYVWDGDETTYTGVIREITVFCSQEELDRGYREEQRKRLVQDAEERLYEHLGYVPQTEEESEEAADNEVVLQKFSDEYGFSLSEAVNNSSDYYILNDLVDLFERKQDSSLPDREVWEYVVSAVLGRIKAACTERSAK